MSNGFGSNSYVLPPEEAMFGRSAAMAAVREKLRMVSAANVPVLIEGESGTGKELMARYIHQNSPWRNGPIVKVSCPAIPGTLLESELFGYEKGAFTGAFGSKPGRVELADRGTLFLDEIGDLDLALQAKLLQLLQDGQFCRIGAQEDRRVDVRIICATNRELSEDIEAGTFRQDLFYRINVVNIHVPPLRDRSEDVPILVNHFLQLYNENYCRRAQPISPGLMRILEDYHWPGNVRELENVIKRYVVLGSEDAISSELKERFEEPDILDLDYESDIPLKVLTKQAVLRLEKSIILRVLQANHWNRKRAARALHISYRALLYKLKDTGIPPLRGARQDKNTPAATSEGRSPEAIGETI